MTGRRMSWNEFLGLDLEGRDVELAWETRVQRGKISKVNDLGGTVTLDVKNVHCASAHNFTKRADSAWEAESLFLEVYIVKREDERLPEEQADGRIFIVRHQQTVIIHKQGDNISAAA